MIDERNIVMSQSMIKPNIDNSVSTRPVLDDITVIIPTVGRPILESCLQRLAGASTWPARIVVVDQSASLTVKDWLDRLQSSGLQTCHIPSSQRGKAAALNRGIEQVTTRFVAVTDDDCFVEHDWLEKLTGLLHGNPRAIVTGPADPEGDEETVAAVTSRTLSVSRRPRLEYDIFCGSNMGAATNTLARIGPFDEDACLLAAEDCEYAYRALRVGVPILYTPEVVVKHFGWRDTGERTERYELYARSHGGFYGKYLRRGDLFIALRASIHFARASRRWLRGIFTGNRELALNGRAYVVGLVPGVIAGFRRGKSG